MSTLNNRLKVASFNLSGLDLTKINSIQELIEKESLNVINIQETHFTKQKDYWTLDGMKKYLYPCQIFNSYAPDKANAFSGVLTIVKPSARSRILKFSELVKGRLTNLKLENEVFGVYNIVNWYGVHKSSDSNFKTILQEVKKLVGFAVTNNERIIIAGDLNCTTDTRIRTPLKPKDNVVLDWMEKLGLIDIVPLNIMPTYRSHANGITKGLSRPDHIISTHFDHAQVWDIETTREHKGVAIEYTWESIQSKLPIAFKKIVIHPSTLKRKARWINSKFSKDDPKTIQEVHKVLLEIVEAIGVPINNKPTLVCNHHTVKKLSRIHRNLRVYINKRKHLDEETCKYIDWNFDRAYVLTKIREVKRDIESAILTLLKERKTVFQEKVNNLQTKKPFSYSFKKETNASSIFKVCQSNDVDFEITDHFSKMFNTALGDSQCTTTIPSNPDVEKWVLNPITSKGLSELVRKTKNSMPGYDNISVQLLKVLDKTAMDILARAYNGIIITNNIPPELKQGILIPLPKVGNTISLGDFRPIVVLPTLYRVFSAYINEELGNILEAAKIIHPAQRGFRRKGSTHDHLITLRTAISEYRKNNKQIYTTALDITNAYGSVIHQKLLKIGKDIGLNDSTVDLVKAMLDNNTINVLASGAISTPFTASMGVPQGDPSSPLLFNLYINQLTTLIDKFKGITVMGQKVVLLLYADDILILSESKQEMQQILNAIAKEALQLGLHFAPRKCKLFGITESGHKAKCKVKMYNSPLEDKEPLQYLGATLNNNLTWNKIEPTTKIMERLEKGSVKHLHLNTVVVTVMSKIVSIPRYLAGIGAVEKKDLLKLDVKVANWTRQNLGLNYLLSKAVIFGGKSQGGLGITAPSALLAIEQLGSCQRFLNSTSDITKTIAREALISDSGDKYWKFVQDTLREQNWSTITTNDSMVIVDSNGIPVNVREQLLMDARSADIISHLGEIDSAYAWHPLSLSFWDNKMLSVVQQRHLFAHVHKAEILRSIPTTPHALCHVCKTEATWEHVFCKCRMASAERITLYKDWDEICSSFQTQLVRLPNRHNPSQILLQWNGVITNVEWNRCNQKFRNYNTQQQWGFAIYKRFAIYIGSCYKNATWNSSKALRKEREYIPKPKTVKFLTEWERQTEPLYH